MPGGWRDVLVPPVSVGGVIGQGGKSFREAGGLVGGWAGGEERLAKELFDFPYQPTRLPAYQPFPLAAFLLPHHTRGTFIPMPRVMLNGQDYVVQPMPLNWSELLSSLDRDLEPRGFLVTAIRVDGVDQPDFRGEDRGALGRDAIIEVDASTPSELLEEGLLEAARSVTQLRQAATALATGYRQTDVSEANAHLATFADTLANLMALVAAAGQAMHVQLDDIRVEGMPGSAVIRHLNNTIEALLEAHSARDWVTLADVLEHDLAPLMPNLGQVIEALAPAPQ
jgi:hypothetical protein